MSMLRAPIVRTLPSKLLANTGARAYSSGVPSKDELNPQSKDSTRSSTNDDIAQRDAAYDPHTTNPASEKASIGREEGTSEAGAQNPLEYSGATPGVSHQKRDDRTVKGKDRPPSKGNTPKER